MDNDSRTYITNIFVIGFRCNADDFILKFLNIRKYSSPFSYMIIDIRTAFEFIDNKFINYTDKEFLNPGNNTLTLNKRLWTCKHIHKCSIIPNYNMYVYNIEKVCIWRHHDLNDVKTVESIVRRGEHLLSCLKEKSDTLLLFYIDKIQQFEGIKCYFDRSMLEKYDCKFLILIPFLNFNTDPYLYHDDPKVKLYTLVLTMSYGVLISTPIKPNG